MNHRHPQLEQAAVQASFRSVPFSDSTIEAAPEQPAKFAAWVRLKTGEPRRIEVIERPAGAQHALTVQAQDKFGALFVSVTAGRLA